MVNASLQGLTALVFQLTLYQLMVENNADRGDVRQRIGERTERDVKGWMQIAAGIASDFDLKAAQDRIEAIEDKIERGMNWGDLSAECRVLRETIESGLKGQMLYRYPADQAAVLMRWREDWSPVLAKFPSAEADIKAAVDCWALHYGDAAVFHAMRILEKGLAVLANDVGRTFGMSNWQNVINEIESEIRRLSKDLPKGDAKVERLSFLSEAAKEFMYFKDGWRNHTAHGRSTYNMREAYSALEHVRVFMTVLSTRLSEIPHWSLDAPPEDTGAVQPGA